MCSCQRVCRASHVLWSLVYLVVGSVQLILGLLCLFSLPICRLGTNVFTGAWTILMGVSGSMTACAVSGPLSPRKHETLLYMAISVLVVNAVNAAVLEVAEWHYWHPPLPDPMQPHWRAHTEMLNLVKVVSRFASIAGLFISFLDSQFSYCALQMRTGALRNRNARAIKNTHEQVSDIEYIIPRKKSVAKQAHNIYSQYAQSWVYDAADTTTAGSSSKGGESPYHKMADPNGNPLPGSMPPRFQGTDSLSPADSERSLSVIRPTVHVELVSDESCCSDSQNGCPGHQTSNSKGAILQGRNLHYMKSFSRTPSPAPMSAASSSTTSPSTSSTTNIANTNNSSTAPAIYECLERLTEPTIYRSRLNTALSLGCSQGESEMPTELVRPRSETFSKDQVEQVQYASLMSELQRTFKDKQPSTTQSSIEAEEQQRREAAQAHSKSSDAEFSKELEAALKLIQDLESPNTIETPSDPCQSIGGEETLVVSTPCSTAQPEPVAVCVQWSGSGSTRTLSEDISSLQGKQGVSVVPIGSATSRPPSSAEASTIGDTSTSSGYSSPSPPTTATRLVNDKAGYTIRTTPKGAVISLTPKKPNQSQSLINRSNKGRYAVRIPIGGNVDAMISKLDEDNIPKATYHMDHKVTIHVTSQEPKIVTNVQNNIKVSSNKRKAAKSKQGPPKMLPELEGAILKSESLAFLSELELIARYEKTKALHREIEERCLQRIQGLSSVSESDC